MFVCSSDAVIAASWWGSVVMQRCWLAQRQIPEVNPLLQNIGVTDVASFAPHLVPTFIKGSGDLCFCH